MGNEVEWAELPHRQVAATSGTIRTSRPGESLSAATLEPSRHEAMQRSLVFVPLAASLMALSATAQTGRTMKLMAPVVIGQTASMVIQHLPSLAGHQFAMAMCSPSYPGALPVSLPGVAQGVLLLDPLAYGVLGIGVLDASGQSPALTFLVPNDPLLVGASFDVQGADIDGSGLITLTDNDLEIEVAAPPPAGLNMVAIAAGTFQMGSAAPINVAPYYTEAGAQPVHQVEVTRPFWIGKYEVTQAAYQALIGRNPSLHQGSPFSNQATRPVECVSWVDAMRYCDALTAQESLAGRLPSGYEYRLPTEAEWEYCCRAATTTEWAITSYLSCLTANVYDNGYCAPGPSGGGQTRVVGSYIANAWGLHDMHGNVMEWCLDSWDGSANYPAAAVSDPLVLSGQSRALRGGGWSNWAYHSGSADRGAYHPLVISPWVGFRVVCAPAMAKLPAVSNMVAIGPGTCQMGSTAHPLEQPVRSVTLSSPFWIGESEVSQGEYLAVVGTNPSQFQGAFLEWYSKPVERVSWLDAVAFCDALTVLEGAAGRLPDGHEYRLPTEAEWEYCCRAGTTTQFNVGDSLACWQAVWGATYGCFSVNETASVSGGLPNLWGLKHMHGNVWEYCLDGWDGASDYNGLPTSDPFSPTGPLRLIRGGSWSSPFAFYCRSAMRFGVYLGTSSDSSLGFRVVCAPILP